MTGPTLDPPTKAVISSEHSLVGEAVGAGLRARGLDIVVRRWPDLLLSHNPRPRPRRLPLPDVGVLLSDLDHVERVAAGRLVISQVDVPWLVLSQAPPGPAWGAVLDAGARAVLPSTTTLDELVEAIEAVVHGLERPAVAAADRRSLVDDWHAAEGRRLEIEAGVAALTARELEVLRRLHAGEGVQTIANDFETAEATVRSQVKSVLRKLGTGTQVSAVVAYELVRLR